MKTTVYVFWGFVSMLCSMSEAIGQNYGNLSEVLNNLDVNLVGAGARAEGLGGAFIGIADDATSVLWNPAGLATLDAPEGSVVVRTILQKAAFTNGDAPEENNTQDINQFALNFGSIAYPLRLGGTNVVLAVAYEQQLNLKNSYAALGGTVNYQNSGGANTVSPGIGITVTSFLSVGIAANFWLGRLNKSDYDYYDNYDTSGVYLGRVETHNSSGGTFSGTNFIFGLLFDLSEVGPHIPLKFGISAKTPFDLNQKFSGTYTDSIYGDISWYGTQTVQMPLMLGFGVSYRIGDFLTLSADYDVREFKGKKIRSDYYYSDGSPLSSDTVSVTESNQNLNQLRIGAEYLIATDIGVFPVRVGYRTVPTVLANQNPYYTQDAFGNYQYNPGISGQVTGSAFSVGSGYITKLFAFDFAYSSTSYTQSLSSTSNIKFSTNMFSASIIIYL